MRLIGETRGGGRLGDRASLLQDRAGLLDALVALVGEGGHAVASLEDANEVKAAEASGGGQFVETDVLRRAVFEKLADRGDGRLAGGDSSRRSRRRGVSSNELAEGDAGLLLPLEIPAVERPMRRAEPRHRRRVVEQRSAEHDGPAAPQSDAATSATSLSSR